MIYNIDLQRLWEPLETCENLSETYGNPWEPLKASQNLWEPLNTSENLWIPLKTTGNP